MNNLSGLFSKTNVRFFELLISEGLSVRGLAEKTNCSPAKASQAVKLFLKRELVKTKKEKNKKIVFLNRENPLMREIISLIFIDKIINSRAFKEMKKKSNAIGVYGSVVEGTMDRLSDIDLWVLSEKKLSMLEIGEIKNKLSKELGREVSVKVFTMESLERLKKEDKIFFNEIESKSKILHGEGI